MHRSPEGYFPLDSPVPAFRKEAKPFCLFEQIHTFFGRHPRIGGGLLVALGYLRVLSCR
jgi:hypothetical protein